jgi:hypothetical protein
MAGRTRGLYALPRTFGFTLAGWIIVTFHPDPLWNANQIGQTAKIRGTPVIRTSRDRGAPRRP